MRRYLHNTREVVGRIYEDFKRLKLNIPIQ